MDILDLFEDLWQPPLQKVPIYLPLTMVVGPSQDLLKTLLFWPNFDHFGPLWGSWRRVADPLGPITAAFGLEGPVWAPQTMPGPQILVILTTFPIEKVNFCHFAYQGSVKMPFWPYFDPFEPSWGQTFGLSPKCAYLGPLPWRDLGGPSGTLIWP